MSHLTSLLPNEELWLLKDQLSGLFCLIGTEDEREAKGPTSVTVAFLLTTESFSLEDGNPSSLEEVREEYVKRHFSNHR